MEDEQMSQEDFLKAFGVAPTTPTNNEADTNTSANATNDNPDGANPGTESSDGVDGANNNQQTQQQEPSNTGDNNEGNQTDANKNEGNDPTSKSAQAFAAMRVELARKDKLLEGVATVLGLDPKSKESMDQLQGKLNEALAKKQGIDPEILIKLNKLEEMETQRNIEQVRNNAFMGFQKVKTKYGLSDEQLQEFANQLVADGKNPFVTQLDLESEYKLKNFDKIMEEAKAKGAQEEIARAAKAGANASTPGNNQGVQTNNNDAKQITTIKGLTEWFNQQQ